MSKNHRLDHTKYLNHLCEKNNLTLSELYAKREEVGLSHGLSSALFQIVKTQRKLKRQQEKV